MRNNLQIADDIIDAFDFMCEEERILAATELDNIEHWIYRNVNMILIEKHTKDEIAASAYMLYKHIKHRKSHQLLEGKLKYTMDDLREQYASLLNKLFPDDTN